MQTCPDTCPPVVRGLFRFFYRPADQVVSAIEALLLILCSLAILAAMGLTTLDVVLRYGFSSPMRGAFDFIMLYLMPSAYYLAFSYGMKTGAHLSVDFFVGFFPRILMRTLLPALLLIAAALMAFIGDLIGEEAISSFRAGETLFGSIAWLTWPTGAIMASSFLLLSVRLVLVAFRVAFLGD
jgi:TRAP-type C4-dicarboxylate transport system permease small subunit